MILSYVDLFDKKRLQHRIKANVTTNHPASHYGQPVILLEDGKTLDSSSWTLHRYRVLKANKKEISTLLSMGLVWFFKGRPRVPYDLLAWKSWLWNSGAMRILCYYMRVSSVESRITPIQPPYRITLNVNPSFLWWTKELYNSFSFKQLVKCAGIHIIITTILVLHTYHHFSTPRMIFLYIKQV